MNATKIISGVGHKVKLQIPRGYEDGNSPWKFNPACGHIIITHSLPYFQSSYGTYVHRVRSGLHHLRSGEYLHTSLSFWCGMHGFAGSTKRLKGGGHFFSEPPKGSPVCATCEGRAIGAGQTKSRKIRGRIVRYEPR